MKKKTISRLCCFVLVALMALAFCLPAFAAVDSMSNFSRMKTYANQYSDVSSSHWAYGAIKTCYETSLMQGSDGSFKPASNLTVAEALVMADRVHQIYSTGANTLGNGTPWYQPYVDYAIENGIINANDFSSYTAKISRADMAYIFSRALPVKEFGKLNNIGAIPDLNSAPGRDQNPILLLYYAGVLTGSDSYGSFHPNDNITRAEAAAIISRVAIPAERKNITLLYKVQDGIVTFGIPQTGALQKENYYNRGIAYQSEGSGIMSIVLTASANSPYIPANADITKLFTVSDIKTIHEENGRYNVSVSKAAFGSINAYCIRSTADSSGTTVESLDYMFFSKAGMYDINISWAAGANRSEVQTVINNVLVNGVSASPAYRLN